MEEKKECFDFGEKKVCNVCKCEEGKCECELHEEKPMPHEREEKY